MVFLVPKIYYEIKEKGRFEGRLEGRLKGRLEGRLEGERAARERIIAALDAAGITDPETRRIVMNGHGGGAETPLSKSEP